MVRTVLRHNTVSTRRSRDEARVGIAVRYHTNAVSVSDLTGRKVKSRNTTTTPDPRTRRTAIRRTRIIREWPECANLSRAERRHRRNARETADTGSVVAVLDIRLVSSEPGSELGGVRLAELVVGDGGGWDCGVGGGGVDGGEAGEDGGEEEGEFGVHCCCMRSGWGAGRMGGEEEPKTPLENGNTIKSDIFAWVLERECEHTFTHTEEILGGQRTLIHQSISEPFLYAADLSLTLTSKTSTSSSLPHARLQSFTSQAPGLVCLD